MPTTVLDLDVKIDFRVMRPQQSWWHISISISLSPLTSLPPSASESSSASELPAAVKQSPEPSPNCSYRAKPQRPQLVCEIIKEIKLWKRDISNDAKIDKYQYFLSKIGSDECSRFHWTACDSRHPGCSAGFIHPPTAEYSILGTTDSNGRPRGMCGLGHVVPLEVLFEWRSKSDSIDLFDLLQQPNDTMEAVITLRAWEKRFSFIDVVWWVHLDVSKQKVHRSINGDSFSNDSLVAMLGGMLAVGVVGATVVVVKRMDETKAAIGKSRFANLPARCD